MILPGAPIPSVWLSDLGLPEGYAVRQSNSCVFLVYGSEDVVAKWNHRRATRDAMIREIHASAQTHNRQVKALYGEDGKATDFIRILEEEER